MRNTKRNVIMCFVNCGPDNVIKSVKVKNVSQIKRESERKTIKEIVGHISHANCVKC